MTINYLRRMADKFIQEDIEAQLCVYDEEGRETPLVTLNKGAQQTVIYNFLEWINIQSMLLSEKNDTIN